MAKELLSSAEKFLLERWSETCQLEDAMGQIREKYASACQRVVDAVVEAHSDLDVSRSFPTQRWGNGHLCVGKSNWPTKDINYPSGIWIDNIRLEVLTDDCADVPSIYVWFSEKASPQPKNGLLAVKDRVRQAAKSILPPEDIGRLVELPEVETLVYLPFSSKAELLKQFAFEDGREFVETLVKSFEQFYQFAKILDECFPTKRRSG